MKWIVSLALVVLGLTIGIGGVYFGDADDSPGAGVLGILLMLGAIVLSVRIARRQT